MNKTVNLQPITKKGFNHPLAYTLKMVAGENVKQTVVFGYSGKGGRKTFTHVNGEVKEMSYKDFVNQLRKWNPANMKEVEAKLKQMRPLFTRKFITSKCANCGKGISAAEVDFMQRNHEKFGVDVHTHLCMDCQKGKKKSPKQEQKKERAPKQESSSAQTEDGVRVTFTPETIEQITSIELPKNLRKDVREVMERLQKALGSSERKRAASQEQPQEERKATDNETEPAMSDEGNAATSNEESHQANETQERVADKEGTEESKGIGEESAMCPVCTSVITEMELSANDGVCADCVKHVEAAQNMQDKKEPNESEATDGAQVETSPEETNTLCNNNEKDDAVYGICSSCKSINVELVDANHTVCEGCLD